MNPSNIIQLNGRTRELSPIERFNSMQRRSAGLMAEVIKLKAKKKKKIKVAAKAAPIYTFYVCNPNSNGTEDLLVFEQGELVTRIEEVVFGFDSLCYDEFLNDDGYLSSIDSAYECAIDCGLSEAEANRHAANDKADGESIQYISVDDILKHLSSSPVGNPGLNELAKYIPQIKIA